jgi:hypothetical protein
MVSALALLHVGRRHDHRQQEPQGVDDDRPLASVDLGGPVNAADPPVAVVLTDWLAMIPARDRKTMINARIASTHDQRPAASSMEDLAA